MENCNVVFIEKENNNFDRSFIEKLVKTTCEKMKNYTEKMIKLDYEEIACEHSELSVKTFVSSALDNIADGCFLQEHFTLRKSQDSKGRVDFWCNYDNTNYIIELKKVEAYFNSKTGNLNKWNLTNKALKKSKKQIDDIIEFFSKVETETNTNQYGINFVLTEIRSELDKIDSNLIRSKIQKSTINNIDFYAIWQLKKEFMKNGFDSYSPILVFTGEVKKI